ncbi:MAG: hypothetical protein AB7H93_20175 [Vicinamibacterales bacterium]
MNGRGPAADGTSTGEIVAFLREAAAHGDGTRDVAVVETHMSWLFLTDAAVYKLKKAMRQDGLDFSTPALRRYNCEEEVRLNRRLAPDVYLGVVAVTRQSDGGLALAGAGVPVDWLVHMRRLPAERSLDRVLQSGRADAAAGLIRDVARRLARFYAEAAPVAVAGAAYCDRLAAGVRLDWAALTAPHYGVPRAKVERLATAQLALLDRCRPLFAARADGGHLVEGHGDLRPEHIWLVEPPVVIDCIEFDRTLRVIDPADDLAFLALECERLGAAAVGGVFLDAYVEATGDRPPPQVLGFHRVYRAMRRATIAARHLDDPVVTADVEPYRQRAIRYVEMVEPVGLDAG